MKQTVGFRSDVKGVSIHPSYHQENPASDQRHHHLFFDHYIDIPVVLDGTNEWCDVVGTWQAKIVFLRERTIPRLSSPKEIVPICSGDRLTSVVVTECVLGDAGFGIWVLVNFLPQGEDSLFFHSYRLWPLLQEVTH